MEQTLGALVFLQRRLAEPSSQAIISSMLLQLGIQNVDTLFGNILFVLSTITGLCAFFFKEGKPKGSVE